MTTIVGTLYSGDGGVMAADSSYLSAENHQGSLETPKIFHKMTESGEPMLIGVAGSLRDLQLLDLSNSVLPFKSADLTTDEVLFTTCEWIRRVLEAGGTLSADETGLVGMDSQVLIMYRHVMALVGSDFAFVVDALPYAAIGSGRGYALGSLATTLGDNRSFLDHRDAAEAAAVAVSTACQFDPTSCLPMHMENYYDYDDFT